MLDSEGVEVVSADESKALQDKLKFTVGKFMSANDVVQVAFSVSVIKDEGGVEEISGIFTKSGFEFLNQPKHQTAEEAN